MNIIYAVNTPSVVSEVIDGELVIMDLKSGNYFSAEKTAASIWDWISRGYGTEYLEENISSYYKNVDPNYKQHLREFSEKLIEHQLIRENNYEVEPSELPASTTQLEVYSKPVINIFTDMQDMILLDPIHEVDEQGWPAPMPDQE
jgi:hypothetical protein